MKHSLKLFLLLFFVSVLFTNKLDAQMTLEHTFEGDVYPTIFGEHYYSYEKPEDNSYVTVKIYNYDYSLKKELTFHPLEGCSEISLCWAFSPDLIMAVSRYRVYNEEYDYYAKCFCMYDSNGNIIKNWGRNVVVDDDIMIDYNIQLQNKLIFNIYNENTGEAFTEVYSIDGYESTSEKTIRSFSHAYPNPARNTISLPYNLGKGEKAEMLIYDVNGKMIEKKTIDSTFDKILLNVESYKPGIYFYSVNGTSQKFVVK